MTQLSIAGFQPAPKNHTSDRSDSSDPPITHHVDSAGAKSAADRITRSGKRTANKQRVLDAVYRWPGLTTKQIANFIDMDRHEVARRMSDLHHAGKVERGPLADSGEYTWFTAA